MFSVSLIIDLLHDLLAFEIIGLLLFVLFRLNKLMQPGISFSLKGGLRLSITKIRILDLLNLSNTFRSQLFLRTDQIASVGLLVLLRVPDRFQ